MSHDDDTPAESASRSMNPGSPCVKGPAMQASRGLAGRRRSDPRRRQPGIRHRHRRRLPSARHAVVAAPVRPDRIATRAARARPVTPEHHSWSLRPGTHRTSRGCCRTHRRPDLRTRRLAGSSRRTCPARPLAERGRSRLAQRGDLPGRAVRWRGAAATLRMTTLGRSFVLGVALWGAPLVLTSAVPSTRSRRHSALAWRAANRPTSSSAVARGSPHSGSNTSPSSPPERGPPAPCPPSRMPHPSCARSVDEGTRQCQSPTSWASSSYPTWTRPAPGTSGFWVGRPTTSRWQKRPNGRSPTAPGFRSCVIRTGRPARC